MSRPMKSDLSGLFGIEFDQLNSVIRHIGDKQNIIRFGHRVIDVNIELVVGPLPGNRIFPSDYSNR